MEGQLEVADRNLRSTRAFLEEQAVEREQEREDWERRLALAQVHTPPHRHTLIDS